MEQLYRFNEETMTWEPAEVAEVVPNRVIHSPEVRKWLGGSLFVLGALSAVAALLFAFFPELTFGTDIPTRVIAFVNALISLVSNMFGIIVSTPNVPERSEP